MCIILTRRIIINYRKYLQDYELHPVSEATKPRKRDRAALSSAFELPNSTHVNRSHLDNEPQRKRSTLVKKHNEHTDARRPRGHMMRQYFLNSYFALENDMPTTIAQRFGIPVDALIDCNKGR